MNEKLKFSTLQKDIFSQKGFDGARIEDIAGETGVSKGTLYLCSKSKDRLIFAILVHVQRIQTIRGATKNNQHQPYRHNK